MTMIKPVVLLCALTACLCAAQPAHATFLTANGVDSGLGGFMAITGGSSSFDGGTGDYTITLNVENTSATESYQGVELGLEFMFPANGSSVTNGNGFDYLGSNTWENSAHTEELQFTSASPYSLVSQSLSPALIDIPLSGTSGSFSAGSGSPRDACTRRAAVTTRPRPPCDSRSAKRSSRSCQSSRRSGRRGSLSRGSIARRGCRGTRTSSADSR